MILPEPKAIACEPCLQAIIFYISNTFFNHIAK